MAKNSFSDWSVTPASNTDIGGIGITGASLVSNFDDAMRTMMAQLRAGATAPGVTLSITGAGLSISGGGVLDQSREITFNLGALPITTAGDLASPRAVVTDGADAGSQARLTPSEFLTAFGAVPTARTVTSGKGIRGGGDLSANITLAADLAALPAVSTYDAPRAVVTDGATTGTEARMSPSAFRTAFECLAYSDLVYTGSSTTNTAFPIGTEIACKTTSVPNRNALASPRLSTADTTIFTEAGSGSLLSGVWRSRGGISSDTFFTQRTG